MIKLLRTTWDRLSIYLPILLMGVLALGTYWLVRSTPTYATQPASQQLRHDPDYQMKRILLRTFENSGQLKSELEGQEARHFPDTDTLEIEQIKIKSYGAAKVSTTGKANRALVNGDASEVQLVGNAQVIKQAALDKEGKRSPEINIQSDFLHINLATEIVKSHKPVEITRGNSQFSANALEFDNFDQVVNLKGRVRGVLVREATK